MASRSEQKAKEAMDKIKAGQADADLHFLQLDLTDLSAVKASAEKWASENERLDILLNNAGVMATPYEFTKDGLELQVGTNVVGHYLFTALLLPTLVRTAKLPEYKAGESSVRIVHLSSLGHTTAPGSTSFKDLEAVNRQYRPEVLGTWLRYGKSKAGNILLANEFKKLIPAGVPVVNVSVHPGVIATGLLRGVGQSYGSLVYKAANSAAGVLVTKPEAGALTQLYAATSPEIDSKQLDGEYLVPVAKLASKAKVAKDEDGKLGGELMAFCKSFVKEKAGVDIDAVFAQAGIQTVSSHL